MSDFDMADARRRIAAIESGEHDVEYRHVFDLVHAVFFDLLNIAKREVADVNQNLSNRLPEDVSCEIVIAAGNLHPLLRPRKNNKDWKSISRYIEMSYANYDEGAFEPRMELKAKVRVTDHRRRNKAKGKSKNPEIKWVKFNIKKSIMLRSAGADGDEYAWSALSKDRRRDLMNGRNALVPGASEGGREIVRPTFYIHPDQWQSIMMDGRSKILKTIHDLVRELELEKWSGE